jgi:hypothetical protein
MAANWGLGRSSFRYRLEETLPKCPEHNTYTDLSSYLGHCSCHYMSLLAQPPRFVN